MNRLRVCSVDFLNSTPLVWGLLHGEQQGLFDLRFEVPSECASQVASGAVDIGNIPVIELARQGLEMAPGVGVAAHGAVRSILLISKRPATQIRTLAADTSSRTSVALARIILARRYGVEPEFRSEPPDLTAMLESADAALIIGDPALRLDLRSLPYQIMDLGEEWTAMTGLPMVFAVWAGRSQHITPAVKDALVASCRYGRTHLDDIVRLDGVARGIPERMARQYLSDHIVNELSARDYDGLDLYLRYAKQAGCLNPIETVSVQAPEKAPV